MSADEELNKKLALLYRIQGISFPSPEIEKFIAEGRVSDAENIANQKINDISRLLGLNTQSGNLTNDKSELWKPIDYILTEDEYVLPPELAIPHANILRDIISGKEVRLMSAGGMLIYGKTPGTGKTTEFYHLAGCAGDKAIFVVADISKIINSDVPATVLKQLYSELDALALKENKTVVLLLDEFERIVNMYSEKHSSSKKKTLDRSSEKNHNREVTEEKEESFRVDDVGIETIATLKSLISGGENIKRVVTIATSNQETYEKSIERRLTPILLLPFGFPTKHIDSYDDVPDYAKYAEHIPRILKILQATHFKNVKAANNNLIKIEGEINEIVKNFKSEVEIYEKPLFSSKKDPIYDILIKNNFYLNAVLKYFNSKASAEELHKNNSNIRFSGYFDEQYLQLGKIFRQSFRDDVSPEVKVMKELTPSTIAKWYNDNPDVFKKYNSAKKYLGQKIIPQLEIVK
jgi:hypothetical protein